MIEKLQQTGRGFYDKPAMPTAIEFFNKINEVIDAVNALQESFESIHPRFNYKDKLKWVGRRCNFSNDCENWIENIFVNIDRTDSEPEIPKYRASNGKLYKYCELVTEPEPAENLLELAKKAEKECRFNPLQADRETYNALTSAKNVPDRFAEQRKWIGKLCKFDGEHYGILKRISNPETRQVWKDGPFGSSDGNWYDSCEPVKPDDGLIYKGE